MGEGNTGGVFRQLQLKETDNEPSARASVVWWRCLGMKGANVTSTISMARGARNVVRFRLLGMKSN